MSHPLLMRLILVGLFFGLIGCHQQTQERNRVQGYIEGDFTYMAASVSGRIIDLLIQKGSKVAKDQQLFTLEPQPELQTYQAALENLKENMAAADAIKANLSYAKITYERYKTLVPQQAIQQSQLDNAKAIYNSTIAQLSQANANIAAASASLAQAKWTLDQKIIKAPVDALVYDTFYHVGEYIQANQAVLSLQVPGDIKAVFFLPEAILGSIRVNDTVKVNCDGCPALEAKVSYISTSAEYTPPIIYSSETSSKLIFRVEAVFNTQDAYKVHPGQPVIVAYTPHG